MIWQLHWTSKNIIGKCTRFESVSETTLKNSKHSNPHSISPPSSKLRYFTRTVLKSQIGTAATSLDSRLSSVSRAGAVVVFLLTTTFDEYHRRLSFKCAFVYFSTSIFNNQSRIFKFWIFQFFPSFQCEFVSNSLQFKWNKFRLIFHSEFQLTTTLFHYCVYSSKKKKS